ncbi:MAG: cobalamin B12-binding domain-containing protein [Ktedonobacteraceae bacterium]|nr:cobalamin B12-binding domain-containing protein [Ktedonobacteraceae bacterium]
MTLRVLLTFADPHQVLAISPYGLEILRGHLKAHGVPVDVQICNPFIEDLDPEKRLRQVLDEYRPHLVGFSLRNIDNSVVVVSATTPPDGSPCDVVNYMPAVRQLVRVARDWNADVPLVLGGAGFTSCPEACLRYFDLDFGLIGPAEDAFRLLIEALISTGAPYYQRVAEVLPTLPGAVYRENATGTPSTRPGRLLRMRQDTFHLHAAQPRLAEEPAYTAEIAPEYRLFAKLMSLPIAIRTKTGCPMRCAYCTDPINMHRTSYRPLEHVIADFAYYIETYDLHKFHIADAEVNLPKEDHLISVCNALVSSGLAARQRWQGYFNIRPCSNNLIDALLRSHCARPAFSVDSFDDRILKAHQKNYTMAHVTDVLGRLLARNDGSMKPSLSILFGEPGETLETIRNTVSWMKHYADLGVRLDYSCGLRVYPNTPLALRPEFETRHLFTRPGVRLDIRPTREGFVMPPDSLSLLETVVYCSPMPPRELAAYLAHEFAGYPNIDVLKEGVITEDGLPTHIRHFNVGVYHLAHGNYEKAHTLLKTSYRLNSEYKPVLKALDLLAQVDYIMPQAA